jgi:hypothetical protein
MCCEIGEEQKDGEDDTMRGIINITIYLLLKVEISLKQTVKAHSVVRHRGSHIF